MDIILTKSVKIPNAVLVSGLTNTEVDNEIFDLLKQYGSISRIIKVPSTDPETQAIAEFENSAAVKALEADVLPCRRPCAANPEVIHHIQSLASVYTSDAGTSATNTYLSGLKDLAKLSGREFGDILREEDKQANKASRMKQHLGFTKPKVTSNMQAAHTSYTEDIVMPKETEEAFLVMTKDIQKQIAELQVQVAKLNACNSEKPMRKKATVNTRQKQKTKNTQPEGQLQQLTVTVMPKPWYCFKCGEDGHIASTCDNVPNPSLVQAKKAKLREKQRAWEAQNGSSTTPQLN